jgi:superfamily I DNA/RNA helicase/mRNA-degrading endonuclease RelE of RelBE toxin-antitoxin system
MSWLITHKRSYDLAFIELPRDLQLAFRAGIDELEKDPITPRGDTIKKLKGWDNVYRLRKGDFRLIYAADAASKVVQLLAVGARDDVYERFNYNGWNVPGAVIRFDPTLVAETEWTPPPDWSRPASARLPRVLTPELLTRWQVEPEFHAALVACRTDNELEAAQVPQETLLRVYDGLWPATVEQLAAQPDQILMDPDDLLRYADGTLSAFLLRLDEQQEGLTRWGLRGPTLVKGGPGSGKSTVALYRLRAVVKHRMDQTGRLPTVLFTTYTNSLTHVSESLLRQLLRDHVKLDRDDKLPKEIRVSTLHKTAQWIGQSQGTAYKMAREADQLEALHAARASFHRAVFGDLESPRVMAQTADLRDAYLLEEFDWAIEGQDCRQESDYLAADRAGRGIPFGRARRSAVWRLYEVYREHLTARGLLTWGQLVQMALDRVRGGHFPRRWDYVIVDEAQDLSPAALALAVELCQDPAGVFLTADANQSLYNRGFRWNRVHSGLTVTGRARTLGRNYRSTREIAGAAAEILGSGSEVDEEAARQEYVHSGPRPVLYAAPTTSEMWRWIAQRVFESARALRLPPSAAVVLVPSSDVGQPLADALRDHRLPAQFMNSHAFNLDEPCVKVTTLHAAKGLEFPIVVVAHVEAGRLPRASEATDPDELAAFMEHQRRLFYVGCTRAMRRLFVTYDWAVPSAFVQGLSADKWEIVS